MHCYIFQLQKFVGMMATKLGILNSLCDYSIMMVVVMDIISIINYHTLLVHIYSFLRVR